MIITLTPPGGQPVTVGDDTVGDYISGLTIAQRCLVDAQERMRATHVAPISRGNAVNTVTWQVNVAHADESVATAFRVAHPDEVPTAGQLTIFDNLGNPIKRFVNAVKQSVAPVAVDSSTAGVSTLFAYEFICGPSDGVAVGLDENNAALTDEGGAALLI